MQWTTEKPTVPGYYWVFCSLENGKYTFMKLLDLELYEDDGPLVAYSFGSERFFDLGVVTHWMGPITEPKFQ